MPPELDVGRLVREGRAAVREAAAHAHRFRAWEALQERDADGGLAGVRPYSDRAIAELLASHESDPDDVGVVHHLAIAFHARAWDRELRCDPDATADWKAALGHWRTIAASAGFWGDLRTKYLSCDPAADPALLLAVRRDLLEHLLEIHVDFIRHYCGGDAPGRASDHVEIIRQASLPRALRAAGP